MSALRYLDVCSGVSAPTAAWKPLGWQALCYAEIEAAPRAVLDHHYPDVPLRGDFTEIKGTEYGPVDLLVGGTPCQSFSIAGLRGGLADDRGNLALEYLRLADRARPRWLVWENVPGVLSSNGGRDFGAILGGMAELGYGFAYRILDAQHFGVPQRRRRVFVVGYLGDWRRAAAVLFERYGLSGHPAPRREAREGVAICPTLRAGGNSTGGHRPPGTDVDTCESLICATVSSKWAKGSGGPSGDECQNLLAVPQFVGSREVAGALTANYGKQPDSSDTGLGPNLAIAFSIMPMNSGKDYRARETDVAQPIMAGGPVGGNQGGDFVCQTVAFAIQERAVSENIDAGPQGKGYQADVAYTLEARNKVQSVAHSAVRRLTPRECERLQGFSDDFTLVPYRGRMMADGPRYKMLGNSMAVPVMRWIGERIAKVEALNLALEAA